MSTTHSTLLAGRRGLVLGMSGANSMAYHCVANLSALGAEVAVSTRPSRQPQCEPLAKQAGASRLIGVDLDAPETIASSIQNALSDWPSIDFVVHTYMHVPEQLLSKPLTDVCREHFSKVMEIGVHSLLSICQATLPKLMASPHGARVVALTSALAEQVSPNYHVAGIAKAALNSAIRYLAFELGPKGILCNGVSFSLLPTSGAEQVVGAKIASDSHALIGRRNFTKKPLEAADVTNAVAYLVGPLCSHMTGEIVTVDGGFRHAYF